MQLKHQKLLANPQRHLKNLEEGPGLPVVSVLGLFDMEIYGDASWVQRSILSTLFAARNVSSRDSDCAWETAPLNTLDLGSKTWQTSTNVTSIQLFISFDHTRKYRVHWSPAKCKGFDYAFQLQHSKPSEYHRPAGENSRTDSTTQQDTWDIRSNYLSEGHKDSYVPVHLLPNLMAKRTVRPLKRSATADFKNTIHNIESVVCTWTFDELVKACCLNHHFPRSGQTETRMADSQRPVITQCSIHFRRTKSMLVNARQDF